MTMNKTEHGEKNKINKNRAGQKKKRIEFAFGPIEKETIGKYKNKNLVPLLGYYVFSE